MKEPYLRRTYGAGARGKETGSELKPSPRSDWPQPRFLQPHPLGSKEGVHCSSCGGSLCTHGLATEEGMRDLNGPVDLCGLATAWSSGTLETIIRIAVRPLPGMGPSLYYPFKELSHPCYTTCLSQLCKINKGALHLSQHLADCCRVV